VIRVIHLDIAKIQKFTEDNNQLKSQRSRIGNPLFFIVNVIKGAFKEKISLILMLRNLMF
jgi:hypothetical protein